MYDSNVRMWMASIRMSVVPVFLNLNFYGVNMLIDVYIGGYMTRK